MRVLYLTMVWLHVLAAVVWIGGMTFLTLVLVPALRKVELGSRRVELLHVTGVRFRRVGWIALGVSIGSGILVLALRGVGWAAVSSAGFWGSSFGRVLAAKLLVVATIIVLSAAHDFFVGPRATRLLRADQASSPAARLRRWATVMGRANLLFALVVLALAVMLVRGVP
jgi:uncharacterized membrane protein